MAQESSLVISIDARNAEKTAKALNKELENIEKKGDSASKTSDILSTSLKSLAGYMAGVVTISKAISMADGYTQMAARIRNATSSAEEYQLVQERILATANTTFRSLGEAQEVYLSMAGGMKSLGYQTTQTLDLVDSLSFSFTHNATRVDQAQSAMDALSKSMAKGKIDADAWISIVTGADNVIADMAKTTGKTESEIRKLGAEGKASLDELIKTLIATRSENERLANNMENSLADGFTKLSNEVTVYLGKLNESTGATGILAGGLSALADNIDTVAKVAGIAASVFAGRLVSAYVAANAASIRMTASTMAQAGAMNVATASARSLYLAMGGPVGLGVTVATVAASYLLLSNNTEESTKSLRENNLTVDDAIKKYKELDVVKKRQQQSDEKRYLEELSRQYKEYRDDLTTNAYAITRYNEVTREQARELNSVIAEYKKTGDVKRFSDQINSLSFVSQKSKDEFNALAGKVNDAGTEFKNQKQFVDAINNSLNNTGIAGENAATGLVSATNALSEYAKKARESGRQAEITNKLLSKGYSEGVARDLAEIAAKNEKVTVEEAKAILYKNQQEEKLRNTIQSRSKAESDAQKKLKDNARESARIIEEQYRLRESIAYKNADRLKKIEMDLQREISEIQKANFSGQDTSGFIENAKNRADLEKQLYIAQLEQELNAWQDTEQEKLNRLVKINALRINLDQDMHDDLKDQAIQSLKDQANYELAMIKLNKEQRIFQAEQAMYSEMDGIRKRYALEREEIIKNYQLDAEEKRRRLAAVDFNQSQDESNSRMRIMSNYNNAIGIDDSAQQAIIERQKAIQEAYDNQLITQEEFQAQSKLSSQQYQADLLNLQFSYGQSMADSMAGIFKTIAGEQSNGYKLMFSASKAFSIAQSALAIKTGIAQAAANPFPYNLVAMATVAAQTASIISDIKAIKDTGFKSGGYTGNMGTSQVAGVVHGQEYVLNAQATKRIGVDNLNALNSGGSLNSGVNVIINVPQGYKAVQTQDQNGVTIDVVEDMITRSWANLNKPNSQESRALQNSYGLQPSR